MQYFESKNPLTARWEKAPIDQFDPEDFLTDLKNTEGDFAYRFCRFIRQKPELVPSLLSKVLSHFNKHPDPETQDLFKDCLVGALGNPEKVSETLSAGKLTPKAEAAMALAAAQVHLSARVKGQDVILYTIENLLNLGLFKKPFKGQQFKM